MPSDKVKAMRKDPAGLAVIDVLLPARDEAAALPHVLRDWPAGLRAIVIDNGSVDGTAEVVSALGADVIDEPLPGYGAAVHAGLLASTAVIRRGDGCGRIYGTT